MSDYRNPNDPSWRDSANDPNARSSNAVWGWIAGAVFLVIVLAVVFGVGHPPKSGTDRVANNTPPATHMAPAPTPAPNPATPSFAPATPPINPQPHP